MPKPAARKPAKLRTSNKKVTAAPVLSINFWFRIKTFAVKKASAKLYAYSCLAILAGTTLLWSILGAKLQQSNADQVVNSYLFENSNTIHKALLPSAHSFLIKWPLFYLLKIFGYSNGGFITLTVLLVLATVAAIAFVLYRIERRPLVFGTICLALASVLLLVPAQSYAGALLPVNMAMLATRNLEYAVYILVVTLLVKSAGSRNRWFWLAVAALGVLVASDKLFLGISILGALLSLVVYARRRRWEAVTLSTNWLVVSVAGALLGVIVLLLINTSGFTHISSESSGAPYSAVNGGKNLVLGTLYAFLGILTNFGANPAYDATVVRDIPHHIQSGLLGIAGPAYLLNLAILGFCVFSAFRLVKTSLARKKSVKLTLDKYSSLALILLFSSFAAFGLFIATNHYYAVDARYLTIALFSLFVCAALFTRNRNWSQKQILTVGGILAAGIIFGTVGSVKAYDSQSKALADINQRNLLIAQVLNHHPVNALVGDYWRVIPTKLAAGGKLVVMPLSSCFQTRQVLSSQAWQLNIENHSFAYLLSLDRSLTDYHGCSLDEVISRYGRPNTSVLVAGSLSRPRELLLFYDRGIHKSAPKAVLKTPSTVLPITLDELPYTTCRVPTIMNIVAHQDDDLLFMSPDLLHDIKAGHCIRTIYVTAGDAGYGQFYWLSRQQGSEAAYSKMLGSSDIWIDRIVRLSDQEFITVANPRGNSKISLIFVHLPDGGLKGGGFAATSNETLAKLDYGNIKSIRAVDGQSIYSADDLVGLMSSLMHLYGPSEIRTQANYTNGRSTDHPDHMAVGRFAKRAYARYEDQQFEGRVTIPLRFYIGYPVHEMPANISDGDLAEKEAAFFEYAKFDGASCQNIDQCNKASTFGSYLARQYQSQY